MNIPNQYFMLTERNKNPLTYKTKDDLQGAPISKTPIGAINCSQGTILWMVDVAFERSKIIRISPIRGGIDASYDLLWFAKYCALQVGHLWGMPVGVWSALDHDCTNWLRIDPAIEITRKAVAETEKNGYVGMSDETRAKNCATRGCLDVLRSTHYRADLTARYSLEFGRLATMTAGHNVGGSHIWMLSEQSYMRHMEEIFANRMESLFKRGF